MHTNQSEVYKIKSVSAETIAKPFIFYFFTWQNLKCEQNLKTFY